MNPPITPSAIEISTVADLRVRLDRPDLADMPDFVSIVADQQAIDALKTELAGLSPEEVASHVRAFVTAHVKKETTMGTAALQLDQLRAAAGQAAKTVNDPDAALTATLSAAPALATAAAQGAIADIQRAPGTLGKIDKAIEHAGGIEDGFDSAFKKFEQEIKKMHPGVYKLLVWLDVFDDEPAEPVAITESPTPKTSDNHFDRTKAVLIGLAGNHGQEVNDTLDATKDKKFTELKKAYEAGQEGISARLGLRLPDQTVYIGLGAIVKQESLIDDCLKKSNPEWQKGSLGEILGSIHGHVDLLDGIIRSMKDLKKDALTGNYKGLFGFLPSIAKDMTVTPSDDGTTSQGALAQRLEDLRAEHPLFKNLSARLILNIKLHGKKITVMQDGGADQLDKFESTPLTHEERAFMNTLTDFGRDMQELLIRQYSFGQEDVYRKFFTEHPLTLSQAFDLFIVTKGEASYDRLDKTEKTMIAFKVFGITMETDSKFNAEYVADPMFGELSNAVIGKTSKLEIPPALAEYMKTSLDAIQQGAINMGDRVLSYVFTIAKKHPEALMTATAAMAGYIFLCVWKPTALGMKIAGLVPKALLVGALAGLTDLVFEGSESIEIDGTKMTKEAVNNHIVNTITDPDNIIRFAKNGGIPIPSDTVTAPAPVQP